MCFHVLPRRQGQILFAGLFFVDILMQDASAVLSFSRSLCSRLSSGRDFLTADLINAVLFSFYPCKSGSASPFLFAFIYVDGTHTDA